MAPTLVSSGEAWVVSDRLRDERDVRRVMNVGQRLAGRLMVLYVTAGPAIRVAFVAGRRIGGAVIRNRARRLMREAWRSLAPKVAQGHDAVFSGRASIADAKGNDVAAEMEALLRRAGLVTA